MSITRKKMRDDTAEALRQVERARTEIIAKVAEVLEFAKAEFDKRDDLMAHLSARVTALEARDSLVELTQGDFIDV